MKHPTRTPRHMGDVLRRARLKKRPHHSLRYVAELLDLTPITLGRIERGEIQDPRWQTIGRYAALVGVSLDQLWKAEHPCAPQDGRA